MKVNKKSKFYYVTEKEMVLVWLILLLYFCFCKYKHDVLKHENINDFLNRVLQVIFE